MVFKLVIIAMIMQGSLLGQKSKVVLPNTLFTKYADSLTHGFSVNKNYYVVEWKSVIPANLNIVRSIDEKIAILEIVNEAAYNMLNQQSLVNAANNQWKLSAPAEKLIAEKSSTTKDFILTARDSMALSRVLKKLPNTINVKQVNLLSHSAIVSCKNSVAIAFLLPLDEIIFLDLRIKATAETGIIGYDRSFHGISLLDHTIPLANGKNIVVGIKEQNIQPADLDVYKRILPSPIADPDIANHATVVASIVGGAGNSFYDGRGIANGSRFFPSSFDNLFPDETAVLLANKVSVQNHSYGTVIQQFYGAEAMAYDAQLYANKHLLHVFSAGNQGTAAATEGRYANLPGYANLTGNFKMAKNVITVGAIDNKENIAPESSAGPLYDGRIAPQLIALGPYGTSDAAAVVTGTIAVMQQVYADSNGGVLPPASLTKAILYNTAEDVYSPGIDYKTGYGLLNSYNAVRSIQQKNFMGGAINHGQQWTSNITVPANTAQLRITLSWTDTAATLNNNKALVNDLDLDVTDITTGNNYKPWVLNTAAHIDSLSKEPTRKRDSLNTSEQVSISLPAAGSYEVKVAGTAISNASLPFHIAFSTDTLNTFRFTNPVHASDVNRAENELLTIRWKTFVADSNETGQLSISYDGGNNWILLDAAILLYQNKFAWQIKDTTSQAFLKMETAFGIFYSLPFVISKVTRINIDYNCADSFRLSWNKHIYASSYKVFALTDSPYLKNIYTVSDTFTLLKRSVYPGKVYAVQPVLTNGIGATRSLALDIDLQGVKCFYNTIYYNLQEKNIIDIIVELSIAAEVDSIYFEKVSKNGQLLKTYAGVKANNLQSIYHQLADNTETGVTYIRARIKLKNGSNVYTETMEVLTTGKRFLLFYPNPVNKGGKLQYVLQQGLSFGSRLQLFDISGRLLKNYGDMPNDIDISNFAAGVLIYKLLSEDNLVLETGKLVIK